jgi:carboxymethylenebutenolidase
MCDDQTERENAAWLSRRDLGLIAGSFAIAAAAPAPGKALAVVQRDVMVKTPDGMSDCTFVAPAKGKHPGVLIWPDIFGLRPAMQQMAKRLAESGYAVLVVNPFYRSAKAPIAPTGQALDAGFRAKVGPMRALLTPEAVVRDATAYVAFLDAQKATDTKRKIGTQGYCMGGPIVLRTAAALPGRIGAGASFHGGGLATDAPDSPHLLAPQMKASFLIAVAENDDQRNPQEKEKLGAALTAAGLKAEIEVYAGAMHGWCPPDSQVYNAAQAEKAWARLLALYKSALV